MVSVCPCGPLQECAAQAEISCSQDHKQLFFFFWFSGLICYVHWLEGNPSVGLINLTLWGDEIRPAPWRTVAAAAFQWLISERLFWGEARVTLQTSLITENIGRSAKYPTINPKEINIWSLQKGHNMRCPEYSSAISPHIWALFGLRLPVFIASRSITSFN